MTRPEVLYHEDIGLTSARLIAGGIVALSLAFVALAFIDPFGQNGSHGNGAVIFFVPAAAFFILALFAISFGRFKIIATADRLTVSAGMNAHSVTWRQIESVSDDLSRPQPCNPMTAVPTKIAGETAMIYAIGCLPRLELALKNDALRYLLVPTRNPEPLLKLIRDKAREARRFGFGDKESSDQLVDVDALDRGRPDGVGGPPPFYMPM
ncbi:hypothetical protein [Dehalogenimonas sp. 4OHTPN]|uniref:PH domain-containing protein n=1 Tax=Dehalogenimonas sp. 4OHTPN TaxID=3166643 RepID=A0AAU8G9A9_9CHLR